jgi:DNA polymerase-3 subunit delta'
MAVLRWNRLVGQERVKGVLGGAFRGGALGHAYLFCGERGVGKFSAAVDLAMAVLCRGAGEERPCGECPSCRKVMAYSHPDFHVIMPLVLQAAHKKDGGALSEEGWAFAAASAKGRIDDPYKLPGYDGIPNIPVDWVREADHAILRGGTEGVGNAAIIDGVDTMSKEAANTMLKTLEEPPSGTLMILLTDKVHAVLPTVVSRCQLVRFGLLPPDVVRSELCKRFGADADDPAVGLAAACGSLGAAAEEFEDPHTESYEAAAALWGECFCGGWEAAVERVEGAAGSEEAFSECHKILNCLIQLLRIAILQKFGAPENYINLGMSHSIELPYEIAPEGAERFVKVCQDALSALEARGNVALVMANVVCTLTEMLNGEEQ